MKRLEYTRVETPAPTVYPTKEIEFYQHLDKELATLSEEGWEIKYCFYEKSARNPNGVYNWLLQREAPDAAFLNTADYVKHADKKRESTTKPEPNESPGRGVTPFVLTDGTAAYTVGQVGKVLGLVGTNDRVKREVLALEQRGLCFIPVVDSTEAGVLGLPQHTKRYIPVSAFEEWQAGLMDENIADTFPKDDEE